MQTLLPKFESALIWAALIVLIVGWIPMCAVYRILDRDPAHYHSGRFLRRLGWCMSRVNRAWRIDVDGVIVENPRNPYVVVCNHLSLADIPIISGLPWEMKWIAKKELLRTPLIGSLMRLAGDIPVDRSSRFSRMKTLVRARDYIRNRCSVMFFPEGTRSPDGKLYEFQTGAFSLAIKAQVPVLPLVIDGSQHTLPPSGWQFGRAHVRLRVLSPVDTAGLKPEDTAALSHRIRQLMVGQLARWRNVPDTRVDGLLNAEP